MEGSHTDGAHWGGLDLSRGRLRSPSPNPSSHRRICLISSTYTKSSPQKMGIHVPSASGWAGRWALAPAADTHKDSEADC